MISPLVETPETPTLSGIPSKKPIFSSFIPQSADEIERSQYPRALGPLVSSETGETLGEQSLQMRGFLERLEDFVPFSGPWLPPQVIKLLDQSKKRQLTESEFIELLDLLAERAVKHYHLDRGKFVAITLSGKIAEVADTKSDLLKQIQGRRYSEQIFIWKVGFDSFSGRK